MIMKIKKYWDFIHYCVRIDGYPFSFTIVRTCTLQDRWTIIIFIIMLLAIPDECLTSTATREFSPDKKGAQKCANRLVGPYTRTCGIHDSTDVYATRQGNNHYIYHNAASYSWRVSDLNSYKRILVWLERGPKVCKPTCWSIYSHVWTVCKEIMYTSNYLLR